MFLPKFLTTEELIEKLEKEMDPMYFRDADDMLEEDLPIRYSLAQMLQTYSRLLHMKKEMLLLLDKESGRLPKDFLEIAYEVLNKVEEEDTRTLN